MMMLSPHFSLQEFVESDDAARLGISNTPGPGDIGAMQLLCVVILEPLREHLARPLVISSGYRSPRLNMAVGGSRNSAHTYGRAADIKVVGMSPGQVGEAVIAMRLPFDQLIIEYDRWLHIAMAESGRAPRHEFLRATKRDNETVYTNVP